MRLHMLVVSCDKEEGDAVSFSACLDSGPVKQTLHQMSKDRLIIIPLMTASTRYPVAAPLAKRRRPRTPGRQSRSWKSELMAARTGYFIPGGDEGEGKE